MARTFATDAQTDFSAGAYPLAARDQIPPNGVEDAINCLISDDGQLYRRGGSSYKGSSAGFIYDVDPGRWVYDAYLAAGQRTFGRVIYAPASGAGDHVIELDPANDLNQITVPRPSGFLTPWLRDDLKAALLRRVLIQPGHNFWAGALDTAPSPIPSGVGSVTLTNGSTTVVGVGTAWTAGGGAGLFLTGGDPNHLAVVASVTDATHLELIDPWAGATITKPAGQWSTGAALNGTYPMPVFGYVDVLQWQIFAAVADKLLAASGGGYQGNNAAPQNRIRMSDAGHPMAFLATNFWDLPAGVQVLGIEAYRDTAIVFSTAGIWGIYNLSLDLTDDQGNVQQRLEELNRDVILWSWAGVANAHGQLVVPAIDGIYLFNPVGGTTRIDGGISLLYRSYVEAGYIAGQATVFGDTYVLPIKNGHQVVDVLSCRLRPTRRGLGRTAYGWTRQSGYGADIASFAVRSRVGEKPTLIGMHRSSGRILTCNYLTPSAANATDADASAHVATITTREFRIVNGVANLLARLRMRYELVGAGTSVTASRSVDGAASAALTAPSAAAPVATIGSPKTWTVGKRGFGVRFILTSAGAATSFVLHTLEALIRPSGRT